MLEFDEQKHEYRLDGVVLPSVTQILEPLSKANYKGIDEDILIKAAYRGSCVHGAIELFCEYGVEDIVAEYRGYFEAFERFASEQVFEPIDIEKRVYHKKLMYAGTADSIAKLDGKMVLIDWKTSSSINEKLYGVQLEAYEQALRSMDEKYWDISEKMVVQLKSNGRYKIYSFPIRDEEKWNVFTSLLTVRNYINSFK